MEGVQWAALEATLGPAASGQNLCSHPCPSPGPAGSSVPPFSKKTVLQGERHSHAAPAAR